MKESPILMNAPMVRATLNGTKKQTRREVKKRAALDCLAAGFEPSFLTLSGNADLCPYGQPGDRLWVREAWAFHPDYPETSRRAIYRADRGVEHDVDRWRPSIHMPRWASRITLEITGVRVEQLSAISREDAQAEGIGLHRVSENDHRWIDYLDKDGSRSLGDPRCSFWSLWRSINGAESWRSNPWVWVVEFKREEGGSA